MRADTPNEALFSFIESLPLTIREKVSYRLLDLFSASGSDAAAGVRALLFTDSPNRQAKAAILVSGALDYVLSDTMTGGDADILAMIGEEEDSAFLKGLAAQAPLAERHFQVAQSAWKSLRAGALSAEALRRFQEQQWARTPISRGEP